jgi:MFS family permease
MAVPAARIGALPGLTEANRRWWTLAGTSMGLFVLMLDSTVINVALPDIARELDATTAGLQWVMNAYLLMLAAFVVSAGRLGDIFGRRRLFVLGMAALQVARWWRRCRTARRCWSPDASCRAWAARP